MSSRSAVDRASRGGDRRGRERRDSDRSGSGIPGVLWIPAALALCFLLLPLVALVLRAPWATLPEQLFSPVVGSSLALSLVSAVCATALCLVLGIPLAWVLARSAGWGTLPRRLLRALVLVPLVLPPVVGGVALLLLLGRNGIVGRYLDEWFGLTIPFTTPAVVIAEAFVAMPFLVLAVEGSLRSAD
ncbi:MAG TPA: hypothetical protein VL242_28935, partial [Sorangium sp.]|nr:hypothetical protein [Sorangium sp.]